MQENHQEYPQEDQQDYIKTGKKPRKDFTRESRDRKRLGDLATNIMLVSSTLSIPLSILTGAI